MNLINAKLCKAIVGYAKLCKDISINAKLCKDILLLCFADIGNRKLNELKLVHSY